MSTDPESRRRSEPPRTVAVPFVFGAPSESARAKSVVRGHRGSRETWARWANWVVGVSSGVFLLIASGGYLYHRGQLADIAAEHLRLMVTGPAVIHVGVPQRYFVRATTVTGEPVQAHVELILHGPDGQSVMAHKETADEQGLVDITVEADPQWPRQIRMEVVGAYSTRTERTEARLAVEPIGHETALWLDRSCNQPGETVRFRSLTLSRLFLTAERELPIRFEVRRPDGSLAGDSVREGNTTRGAAWGEYRIPKDGANGLYAIRAISPEHGFPEARCEFTVSAAGPTGPSRPASGGLQVSFRPEGGELVAGMENRVYFSAVDTAGKPASFSGRIVDGRGQAVALAETTHEGMGSAQFEPQAAEQYRLKIEKPRDGQKEIALPPVSANHSAVLTMGLGVLEPGVPLEFNIRAAAADLPLVAAVSRRGIEVGQQAIVTSVGVNPVTVPLDDRAAGALRLAVYDYRSSPPKLIAERLIYRRPRNRLDVQAVVAEKRCGPGDSVEVPLRVTDEHGNPCVADLSVVVCDSSRCAADTAAGTAMSRFLLLGELESPPAAGDIEFYLSADPKAPAALDLLLGARARRGPAAAGDSAVTTELTPGARPPMVVDNLGQLLEEYQTSLAAYRIHRTRVLNALTTLSFFGGIGLVVFVAMLSLLNIPCGLRLWGPSLGVAAACIVIGAVLMDPERLKRTHGGDVPFASYAPPLETSVDGRQQTGKSEQRAQGLGGFPPSSYEYRNARERTPASEQPPATLVWQPLIPTDPQGHASVRIEFPPGAKSYRLRVDAHAGNGRLGGCAAPLGDPTPIAAERNGGGGR